MIDKILNYKNLSKSERDNLKQEIIESNDARLMFLYLYFVDREQLEDISIKILETGNIRYIHFLLRSFKVLNYVSLIEYILKNIDDPKYLYNILYDVDYLDNKYRLQIINKIISSKDNKYILKALYYYFVILNMFDEELFAKMQTLCQSIFSIKIDKDNYNDMLDNLIHQKAIDPEGFSPNCYEGRNGHIPCLIVCHINNTYNSAINHFYDDKSEVSSHYVIRQDGHIKQVISLDNSAWANGTSLNEDSDVYYKFSSSSLINTVKDNANYFTFSIEHESFDGSLTNEQINSSVKVMKEIIKYLKDKYNYDFPIDREHIIGHDEVNPLVRTKCPGEKFPYDEIIRRLKS